LVILFIIFMRHRLSRYIALKELPVYISRLYIDHKKHPKMWSRDGDCYFKSVRKNSMEWEEMKNLLDFLGGSRLSIKSCDVVYNPVLVSSFINQRNLLKSRLMMNPNLFLE